MWTARALMNNGEDRSLPLSSIERRHASMRELIDPAKGLIEDIGAAVPWHLLDAAMDLGPSPWADPIPLWASEVAAASDTELAIRSFRDNRGNLVLESEAHGIQVWHEATAVVIPVPSWCRSNSHRIRMGPMASDTPHFVEYDPNSEGELLPTLDGRLYAGEKSVVLETDKDRTAPGPQCDETGPRLGRRRATAVLRFALAGEGDDAHGDQRRDQRER